MDVKEADRWFRDRAETALPDAGRFDAEHAALVFAGLDVDGPEVLQFISDLALDALWRTKRRVADASSAVEVEAELLAMARTLMFRSFAIGLVIGRE